MKYIILILTVLAFNKGQSQDNCKAVIDWRYDGLIKIYDRPDGIVIGQVKNDKINEDFLHLNILDETKKYFKISISLTITENTKIGWISKDYYVGAFLKNEKDPMNLILFKNKVDNELDQIIIEKWTPGLLTILKCSGKWTLIRVNHNGVTYSGWIQANKLCANNYSTCS